MELLRMKNGVARITAVVKLVPEKRKEFVDAMHLLHDKKITKYQLLISDWRESCQYPNRFYLLEEWENEEDLVRYSRTDIFRSFLGALQTLCVEANVEYEPIPGEPEYKIPVFSQSIGLSSP